MNNHATLKSVLASLAASAIMIIFGESVVKSTWNYFINSSSSFYQSITDIVYQGVPMVDIICQFLEYTYFLVVISCCFIFLNSFERVRSMLRKEILINIEEERFSETFVNQMRQKSQQPLFSAKIQFFATIFFALAMSLSYISIIPNLVRFQLVSSFNQRLTVLSPYITQQQEKEIKSKWATMHGRKDYLDINETMEDYAKQSSITLPRKKLE